MCEFFQDSFGTSPLDLVSGPHRDILLNNPIKGPISVTDRAESDNNVGARLMKEQADYYAALNLYHSVNPAIPKEEPKKVGKYSVKDV